MPINFIETENRIIFTVRVVPRASVSEVIGEYDGDLKIRIASAPVDGAANMELTRVLAKAFGVSHGSVEIIAGHTSKTKRVCIHDASHERISRILQPKS